MRSVVVLGPDGRFGIHVHRPGCSDIRRNPAYRRYREEASYAVEVEDFADLVEYLYPADDFGYDSTDPKAVATYGAEVKVFGCAGLGRGHGAAATR